MTETTALEAAARAATRFDPGWQNGGPAADIAVAGRDHSSAHSPHHGMFLVAYAILRGAALIARALTQGDRNAG